MEKLKLLGEILPDLDKERDIIITNHVLPLMSNVDDFSLEDLCQIFPNSLGDVMAIIFSTDEIRDIILKNKLNMNPRDCIDFNYFGKCEICDKFGILETCEGTHEDDCYYLYSTNEKGCGIKMCEECIYLNCGVEDNCECIRCEKCAEL